jgi:zinc transporter ZupT
MSALTDPCLPDSWNVYGSYAGLFAMLATLIMQFIEFLAHQRYRSMKVKHTHLTKHVDVKGDFQIEQAHVKGDESTNKEKLNNEIDKSVGGEHVHYQEEKSEKKNQINSQEDHIEQTNNRTEEAENGGTLADTNGKSNKKKLINGEINHVENKEQIYNQTEEPEQLQQTSDRTEQPNKKKHTDNINNTSKTLEHAHHHTEVPEEEHHHHNHSHDHHSHDHHSHDHHSHDHHSHDHHIHEHHIHEHHSHDHDNHEHHSHAHDNHSHGHHHHHRESVVVEILHIDSSLVPVDLCEGSGHHHGGILEDTNQQNKISTYLLELGIALHSVLIGVALGTTTESFVALFIAICFHQFFEAIALGAQIANLKSASIKSAIVMVIFYSLTTPVGIAIGIGIHSGTYNPKSVASLLSSGILDSFAAGILIYVALVNLITAEMGPNAHAFYSLSARLKLLYYMALYLGVTAMAIIGRWA